MKLCLGTVQFGMNYGVQGAHRQSYQAIDKMISYAAEHGISLFDTAAAYGEAEDVMGHYIRHKMSGHHKIRAVSKLAAGCFEGYPKEQWGYVAGSCAQKSISKLGLQKLEAYLFHDASYIYDKDAVAALYSVKSAGLADRAGVSAYTPDEALRALEYEEIEAVQIPYNIFDHRLDRTGFFQEAKKRDITVYARSTLLQGLVTMEASALPPYMGFAAKYLEELDGICKRYGVSRLQAAVGYVNHHDGIDYMVFGADSLEQLKEYLSLADVQLPVEMTDEICERFSNTEERLVNPVLWR